MSQKASGIHLSGQGIIRDTAKKIIKKSKVAKKIDELLKHHHNKKTPKVHIRDILGERWETHAPRMVEIIDEHQQPGMGLISSLKSLGKKTLGTLKRFVQGKTKLKPSKLIGILGDVATVAGVASSFIPGVDLISAPVAAAASTGLKATSGILKKTGRGITPAGAPPPVRGRGKKAPSKWNLHVKNMMPKLKKEHPGKSQGELLKMCSASYKK